MTDHLAYTAVERRRLRLVKAQPTAERLIRWAYSIPLGFPDYPVKQLSSSFFDSQGYSIGFRTGTKAEQIIWKMFFTTNPHNMNFPLGDGGLIDSTELRNSGLKSIQLVFICRAH